MINDLGHRVLSSGYHPSTEPDAGGKNHGIVIIIDVQVQQLLVIMEKAFTVCRFSTVGKKETFLTHKMNHKIHWIQKTRYSFSGCFYWICKNWFQNYFDRLRMEVDIRIQLLPFIIFTWQGIELANLVTLSYQSTIMLVIQHDNMVKYNLFEELQIELYTITLYFLKGENKLGRTVKTCFAEFLRCCRS